MPGFSVWHYYIVFLLLFCVSCSLCLLDFIVDMWSCRKWKKKFSLDVNFNLWCQKTNVLAVAGSLICCIMWVSYCELMMNKWVFSAAKKSLILDSPCPPVHNIWAMMTVWKIRGKIIRTVLCCVHSRCTHIWAVLKDECWLNLNQLRSGLVSVWLFGFSILCLFLF